jgi:hypothetical protein
MKASTTFSKTSRWPLIARMPFNFEIEIIFVVTQVQEFFSVLVL